VFSASPAKKGPRIEVGEPFLSELQLFAMSIRVTVLFALGLAFGQFLPRIIFISSLFRFGVLNPALAVCVGFCFSMFQTSLRWSTSTMALGSGDRKPAQCHRQRENECS